MAYLWLLYKAAGSLAGCGVLVTMVMCVVITIYPADASEIKYMYMLLS